MKTRFSQQNTTGALGPQTPTRFARPMGFPLFGCLWFRHWLSNGAALCGVWLVGSGACPVTDAIALGNVWNSPLVGRGAPPVPRGLSFAVVRSGGRPCCAVFVWFHTTHSRTPSPWAHRAGSAPSPEECPSARRAPLSGAPALPLHTVPPVSSCVLPVLCVCCCCGRPYSCSLAPQ